MSMSDPFQPYHAVPTPDEPGAVDDTELDAEARRAEEVALDSEDDAVAPDLESPREDADEIAFRTPRAGDQLSPEELAADLRETERSDDLGD